MIRNLGSDWVSEDATLILIIVVGFVFLSAPIATSFYFLDLASSEPYFALIIFAVLLLIPLFIIGTGLLAYRRLGRRLSRLFYSSWGEVTKTIGEVLDRRRILYRKPEEKPVWFLLIRPREVILLEQWGLEIMVLGSDRPLGKAGFLCRVMVGKVTDENRERTMQLLRDFDLALQRFARHT